ncbi:MAG: hypothetical protein WCX31_02045 [Salinivirgaceae bacterium]
MFFLFNLVQIPPFLLFILIIILGGVIAGLSTYLFNKYSHYIILRSHNEVTGFLFLSIASFYAFLLSFIVFIVWGQLNETRGNASKEGSFAMGLYRDIKFYPDTVESKQLMLVYLDFAYNVIDEEFPNMKRMEQSRKTNESFNRVFYKMEHLNPKNPIQIQLVAEMFNNLNQLATYRGLRLTTSENEIPLPLWLPILFGAFITIFCSMLLDIEHRRMHIVLNSLLGVFIGMILFIIILLDHPYTGSLGINPNEYRQIFTMEQWYNELHRNNPIEVKINE